MAPDNRVEGLRCDSILLRSRVADACHRQVGVESTHLADRDRSALPGQKRNLAYLRRLPQSRHSTRNLLRPSLTSLFVDHVLPHLERPYLASQPIRIAIWGGLVALQSLVVLTQGIRRISVRPTHIHETGDRRAR